MMLLSPRVASGFFAVTRIALSLYTGSCILLNPPAEAQTGYDPANNVLLPCPADKNCVSSSYSEPPNRYVSPLSLVKNSETAFRQAVRDLSSEGQQQQQQQFFSIANIDPNHRYIHLKTPGTSPGSTDDIELLFSDGSSSIVSLRCEADVTLPPPPFCLQKNCINGNLDQRRRVEKVVKILGLPSSDSYLMKDAKWTPIFFNSDRVPGFDDEF
eukprot:jgi/Psemu1/32165/gm1.32165_g